VPKGITRIENYKRRANGWWVRLQSRGEKFSKFFKDSDYTSKTAALRAAREHRRQLLRDNPKRSRQENAERQTVRTGKSSAYGEFGKPDSDTITKFGRRAGVRANTGGA
jgi:hypothetical protein